MSIISKTLAQEIADKLLEDKKKHLEELWREWDALVENLYEASVPIEIRELSMKFPQYFNKISYFRLSTGAIDRRGSFKSSQIAEMTVWGSQIKLLPENIKTVSVKFFEIEDYRKKIDTLENEIIGTLLGLKTYSRIRESFPEAAQHLPQKTTTAIALNIEGIRSQLVTKD